MTSSSSPSLLIIGGSGFISGALARLALEGGWQVWALTRGRSPLPAGVQGLVADRRDAAAFEAAIRAADRRWDVVVDCIGYEPADTRQDVAVFRERAAHFLFISSDFVYDPYRRLYPQPEETEHFWNDGYGLKKRQCELELIAGDTGAMAWTIVRPCFVYGPGSQLGSLPYHRRDPQLIARLRGGEALKLVGGGHFLQHPIFVRDLAEAILSLAGNPRAFGQIFNAGGPDLVEAAEYFRIIARVLGVELKVEEIPVAAHLAAHPDEAPSCCNRYYDQSKLRAVGGKVPATALEAGLREQVESMLAGRAG